jgi:lipopolysaccharide O-acetyltransferase
LEEDNKICISIGKMYKLMIMFILGLLGLSSDNVLMASKIYISDHNHGSYDELISDHPLSIPINRKAICKPVIVGINVWESRFVLPGVTIGKDAL